MNKTAIEWTDYTWNPVTGCLNSCPYCYARRIAERFRGSKAWPNGFEPTYHGQRLQEPDNLKTPSKIFVCSMGELFGDWLDPEIVRAVRTVVRHNPQHTFQFLTKCPQNLARWNPWPPNAWVGVSVTADGDMTRAITNLGHVDARVRFVSMEPLLGAITMRSHPIQGFLDWIIIGAQTNPTRLPRREWVLEILAAADRAHIPVYMKDNLQWDILQWGDNTRREWPIVEKGEG